jgi:hypothetical protein
VLPLSTTKTPAEADRWASRSAGMDGRGKLSVRTARDGDRMLVEIGGNGPGIPEAAAAHILEPSYTTKPVGKARPGPPHLLAHPSSSATTATCGSLHRGDTRFQVVVLTRSG